MAGGTLIDCSIIECPKHNGRFDIRTGAARRRPVSEPPTVYAIEVAGDRRSVSFSTDVGPAGDGGPWLDEAD